MTSLDDLPPGALLTLHDAATFIPRADAKTLRRRVRQGKLGATRPGKEYLTTPADLKRMLEACRAVPRDHVSTSEKRSSTQTEVSESNPLGLSATELSSAALDSALERLPKKKKRRSATT